MKRALLFVVCITCIANAAPYLTINESAAPPEVSVWPSDTLSIGCNVDAGLIGGNLDFVVSDGSLDPSGMEFNPYIPGTFNQQWTFPWVENIGSTPQYVSIGGGDFSTPTQGEGWVMKNLIFHHAVPHAMTLSMYAGVGGLDYDEGGGYSDIPEGTLLGRVDILTPEPMTIALLGLGGLFLRRRKRL
jgi:hypothetical protein